MSRRTKRQQVAPSFTPTPSKKRLKLLPTSLPTLLNSKKNVEFVGTLNTLMFLTQTSEYQHGRNYPDWYPLASTALANIALYLDVVGKTFYEEAFITPPHSSAKESYSMLGPARSYAARFFSPEEPRTVPPHILLSTSGPYIRSVVDLFHVLIGLVMLDSSETQVLAGALGALAGLCEVPDNDPILLSIPEPFISKLAMFLTDAELRDHAISIIHSLITMNASNITDMIRSAKGLVSELTNIRDSFEESTGEEVVPPPPELENSAALKASSALQMLEPPPATTATEK
ncbi:hypothetical protein TrRE_jg7938 [Triparma retinervis]|uniref:Uncharacterized protein n=1 Tax=Triparma retinervis TaxID=2557542 RepID=A0A9W6ZK45_9STRA|nr:hypothetical protein TrRE_jg7938 [Triparma retinervis]